MLAKMNIKAIAAIAAIVTTLAFSPVGECAIGFPGRAVTAQADTSQPTQEQVAAMEQNPESLRMMQEGSELTEVEKEAIGEQAEMPLYLVFQKVEGKFLPLDPSKPVYAEHGDKFVILTPSLEALGALEANLTSAKQKFEEFKEEKDVKPEALEFACKFYGVNPDQLGGFELKFKDPNHKPSWFESFFKNLGNAVLGTFTGGLIHF